MRLEWRSTSLSRSAARDIERLRAALSARPWLLEGHPLEEYVEEEMRLSGSGREKAVRALAERIEAMIIR